MLAGSKSAGEQVGMTNELSDDVPDSSPKDGSCRTSHSVYCGFGHARASAAAAQPVADMEMNWSLPWGKPVSK